jgi:hypothetical protein
VASSILRRRLRELEEESLEGAALVELLTEAEIAQGAVHEGATRAERLAELGSRVGSGPIVARGERALGRALVATGELAPAVSHLERALAVFGRLGMPLEVGRTRLLLARALAEGEPETAIPRSRSPTRAARAREGLMQTNPQPWPSDPRPDCRRRSAPPCLSPPPTHRASWPCGRRGWPGRRRA